MSGEIPSGMEGALRAAIAANGGGADGGGSGDLLALVAKVLPTLLENTEEREDLVEMQKEGVAAMRKELRFVRRQLHELVRSHKAVLEELRLMRDLQSTMVDHLARVQIIELPEDEAFDDDEYEDEFDDAEELPQVAAPAVSRRRRNTETQRPARRPRRKP